MSENVWETEDRLGRKIRLTKDVAEFREASDKHRGPDYLSTDETKTVVERPNILQQSATRASREVYYRYNELRGKPPYERVVVEFDDEEHSTGEAVSWSRYTKPVSGRILRIWK